MCGASRLCLFCPWSKWKWNLQPCGVPLRDTVVPVGLEYGLVSLGLHCFLRLERALCWRSGQCLVGDAFSV